MPVSYGRRLLRYYNGMSFLCDQSEKSCFSIHFYLTASLQVCNILFSSLQWNLRYNIANDELDVKCVFKVCLFGFIGLACPTALLKAEGIIKGTVLDKNSGEPVIGAAVMLEQTLKGAATDLDGSFSISGIPAGKYNLHVSCLSYTTLKVEGVEITDDRTVELKIVLEAATEALEEVTVRAVRKMNSEVAMVNAVKASPVS